MNSNKSKVQNESMPAEQLFQLCLGFIPAICLNIIAKLSVADHVAGGQTRIGDLARLTNTGSSTLPQLRQPDALGQDGRNRFSSRYRPAAIHTS
jgi:hypothetical protein